MTDIEKGYWIQTNSGIAFDLLNPKPEMINIYDIAGHLTYQNRFVGATSRIYSVAQHSVYVCGLAPTELKLEGLLHERAEAYYHDLSSGLKRLLRRLAHKKRSYYDKLTDRFDEISAELFKLDTSKEAKAVIKEIDNRICLTEKRDLMKKSFIWGLEESYKPYDFHIMPEMTHQTLLKFLEMYELYRRDK